MTKENNQTNDFTGLRNSFKKGSPWQGSQM
jgi:hypothetical protein